MKNLDPNPPQKLGSVQAEENMEADLAEEWDGMDPTDAANEEYFHEVMNRED